jgi:hypothetical protein
MYPALCTCRISLSAEAFSMPCNVRSLSQRVGEDVTACVQVVYVGNLPNSANETNLKELFDTFSGGEVRLTLKPTHPANAHIIASLCLPACLTLTSHTVDTCTLLQA